jgi:hypothetical protein
MGVKYERKINEKEDIKCNKKKDIACIATD